MNSIKHFFAVGLFSLSIYVGVYVGYYEMLEIDEPFYVTFEVHQGGHEFGQSRRAEADEAQFRKFITGGFCVVGALYILAFSILGLLPGMIKDYDSWGMRIAVVLSSLFFIYYMSPILWKGMVLLCQAFL